MINILILSLEAVTLSVWLYLGNELLNGNDTGNYVATLPILLAITEFFRRNIPKTEPKETKVMNAGEKVRHAEELRRKFDEEIMNCRANKLRKDAIIRHVSRKDKYPDIDEKEKGISPWFKVGLLETYHSGINVGLRWTSLVECNEGYRSTNYESGEKGDIKVLLMGSIPFDVIETVNFEGDEYYYFPHIFCHFPYKNQPYERLFFCEEIMQSHGHPWYKEVTDYKNVKRNDDMIKIKKIA